MSPTTPRFALAAGLALALAAPGARAAERTIEMTAARFEFTPAKIEVDQGDQVTLKLRSTDTVHGLAIKEFKVKVTIPKSGEVVTARFTADKAGTFQFTCSEFCGGGHSRMKGTLVVKAKGGAQ
jgi:cytochrome c oxidase subunit 2